MSSEYMTLSELRATILDLADVSNSNVIANAGDYTMLDRWINWSIKTAHRLVASKGYFFSRAEITLDGREEYMLPSDFRVLRKVFFRDTSDPTKRIRLRRLMESEVDQMEGDLYRVSVYGATSRYMLTGNAIRLFPTPTADGTLEIWYRPNPPRLSDPNDVLTPSVPIPDLEELVVYECVAKCYQKQQLDATPFLNHVSGLKKDIEEDFSDRDGAEPTRVVDVTLPDVERIW